MATCETTDFMYPLLADIYYPIVEQNPYGAVKRTWVLDRTVAIAANPAGRKYQQDVQTNNAKLDLDNSILARVRTDITESTNEELYSLNNILITNIRDKAGNLVYNESSGPRSGKASLWEISTFNPIVGAFGSVEYFKLVLLHSDNQAVDV
ncbi:hypothetical protein UFOVP222_37 [uncultured Caudovirales phage]|uniref:Uncharacterized protein n=1 Tax=uncultured Caudovirales phage TaxID=2100421 RepID=A0A6J5TD23_9CAUD|nr:hypothetical protein UFOVP108_32 [uncultured Caudovirales phage]CAB5219188.1 hypothetical protein UFOVP222_37 [uncultured Caudovirales phage]